MNSCLPDRNFVALTKGLADWLVLAMARQVSPYEHLWPQRHIFTLEMDKIVEIVEKLHFKSPRARCCVEFLLNLYGLAGETFVNFLNSPHVHTMFQKVSKMVRQGVRKRCRPSLLANI